MEFWDLEIEEEWVKARSKAKAKAKASAWASDRTRAGSSKTECEGEGRVEKCRFDMMGALEDVQNSNHDARKVLRKVQIKCSIPEAFQSTKITRPARFRGEKSEFLKMMVE